MLHGVHASSAFHQLRREGVTFLYRGIFPPLAQKTVSLALMFGKCLFCIKFAYSILVRPPKVPMPKAVLVIFCELSSILIDCEAD